jgi:hypothetical protein
MSFPQNDLTAAPARGYQGQIADGLAPKYAISRALEDDGGGDTFTAGMPVKWGTDPNQQVMSYEAGDSLTAANFAGLVILDPTRALNSPMLSDKMGVAVLRMGVMFLTPAETVAAGDPVYMNLSTGAFYKSAASGRVRLPGVRWVESGSTADVRRVWVNIAGPSASDPETAEFSFVYVTPAALTGTNAQAEAYVGYLRQAASLVSARIVPGGSLTSNDADYASLNAFKRTSAGASQTSIATASTTTTDTGTWTAGAAEDMGIDAGGYACAAGSAISISITKAGNGVTVPAGTAIVLTFVKD